MTRLRAYLKMCERFLTLPMNLYQYCGNNPINFVDPLGNTVFYAMHPDWNEFAASPNGKIVGEFYAGVGTGALIAGAVVVAAPVVTSVGTSALIAAGVPAVTASTVSAATVTTTLGLTGAVGLVSTGVNTYQNASEGNWDAVAYNAGTVVGGLAVGVGGGGRSLASLNGEPSSVSPSWNPFADTGLRYDPSFPGGSILGWLGSAPTPSSGGLAALGIGSGIATIPTWPGMISDNYSYRPAKK